MDPKIIALNPQHADLLNHNPEVGRNVILREIFLATRETYGFNNKEDLTGDLNPHLGVKQCADAVIEAAERRGVTTTRDEVLVLWVCEMYAV